MTRLHPAVLSCLLWVGLQAATAAAQENWLLDDFSIEVGARANDLDTTVRVDTALGPGTEFTLEDVLGLTDGEDNFGLVVSWRPSPRQRLEGSWATYQRDSVSPIAETVVIGDTVFPVNATVRTEFDIDTLQLSYWYYLALRPRHAFGIGLGARQYEFRLGAEATLGNALLNLSESADVTGPVPFLGLDYRYSNSERWRLRAFLGYIDLEIDEYSGSQLLGELALEFRLLRHLSLGVAGDVGRLDVDVDADRWAGSLDSEIRGLRVFAAAVW